MEKVFEQARLVELAHTAYSPKGYVEARLYGLPVAGSPRKPIVIGDIVYMAMNERSSSYYRSMSQEKKTKPCRTQMATETLGGGAKNRPRENRQPDGPEPHERQRGKPDQCPAEWLWCQY